MCQTRTLSKSKDGFIVQCKSCKDVHVAFGTSLFTIDQLDFIEFGASLEKNEKVVDGKKNQKCFQIPHPSQNNVLMILSSNEIKRLHTLYREASILLETYSILDQ